MNEQAIDFANSVPWFLIPLALDIERGKGKRDLDGMGMAPVTRILP
jgi:hypothetical protein